MIVAISVPIKTSREPLPSSHWVAEGTDEELQVLSTQFGMKGTGATSVGGLDFFGGLIQVSGGWGSSKTE